MNHDTMTQDQYVQFVKDRFASAAQVDDRVVFTNRGLFHAAAVLRETIAATRHDLEVVSGCLPTAAYDPDLLRAACQRISGMVRVVLTDPLPFAEPSALTYCDREIASGKIAVRFLRPYGSFVPTHFALCDRKHLRAEQDQHEKSAIIVLNADSNLSERYSELFESYWSAGTAATSADLARGQASTEDRPPALAG